MPNNIAEHKIKCDEQCGYQTGLHSISWQKNSVFLNTHGRSAFISLLVFSVSKSTNYQRHNCTQRIRTFAHLFQCTAVKNFCLIYRGLWVQISVWRWSVLTGIFPVLLQSFQIPATQWLVTVTPSRCSNALYWQLPNTHTVTASPCSLPEISFTLTVLK
jgi:hypothetical protein